MSQIYTKLTRNEMAILMAIKSHHYCRLPTYSDLAIIAGLKSKSTAFYIIERLKAKQQLSQAGWTPPNGS
jgi:hypothetical protein